MDDDDLVALVRTDAEDLLRMLGSQPQQGSGRTRPVFTQIVIGRTTSAGLATTAEEIGRAHV
jgi:hypothetical protein